jgi:hypothetical protein
VIEVDKGVGLPDLGAEFFAGDEIAGPIEKRGQNLERLTLQAELDAAFPELARVSIKLENVETKHAGGWRTRFGHTD